MTTIITKNSSTASAVPLSGDLEQGELAVNVTDKKLYTKDSGGTVVKVVGSLGNQEASAVAITGGTEAGVAITGGTINNTPVGATTANTVRGTTVTATTGFVGDLTGNVTGNVTGAVTGNVTGNITGNVTGNVTASSGTSTFNNVTINGTLDMNSGSAGTVTGLATPTNASDAATKSYVDTSISNLVDSAPGALDTLNELAAALGDDANFSTTITNSIATKVSKAGDTMSGALAMGTNKITGLGTPTAGTDASTKDYVDTVAATKLNLAGGTMTGNIVMGANKVTSTATPTTDDDLTRKAYVDSILGSATSAATSAAAAATSETNAANSASAAASSATASAASASAAAASYDAFDDRYLGSKSSAPTLDNDGNALLTGAIYWNSTSSNLWVWTGSAWSQATLTAGGFATLAGTETLTNKTFDNATVINDNSSSAALRITQTGSGNALLVEDSANPDSTPFVVDAQGNIASGITNPSTYLGAGGGLILKSTTAYSPQTWLWNSVNDTSAGYNIFRKDRAGAIVQSGDGLGNIHFVGYDGANYLRGAEIVAAVDGTPGTNDMPGRLVFSTTADGASSPSERMRIDNAGRVGIGNTPATGRNFTVSNNITGATISSAIRADGQIQSDVTSEARGYSSNISVADAAFTLASLRHYYAATGTIGAGATVTTQYGFFAESTLTGATNNYGFYSNIASGTGRWNFYAGGTAANYFGGVTQFAKATQETKTAIAASDIDLSTGNYFTKTISGATTFTISNVASSGLVSAFVLDLTNGGAAAVTWFSGVKWNGGTAPTLTASGRDVLAFFTYDGGTTWNAFVLGQAMA